MDSLSVGGPPSPSLSSTTPSPSPLSSLSLSFSSLPSTSSSSSSPAPMLSQSSSPSPRRRKGRSRREKTLTLQDLHRATYEPAVVARQDSQKAVPLSRLLAQADINPNFKGLQFVAVQDVADKILFSQASVSDVSTDRDRKVIGIDTLADLLFVSFEREGAIDIVANEDGQTFTSVDNRRLLVAKRISRMDRKYGIWVRVHNAAQVLKKDERRRFQAETWGEAVRKRINNKHVEYGYVHEPKIIGFPSKSPVLIPMTLSGLDLSNLHEEDRENLLKNATSLQLVRI